jgi:hypothetical protein
MKNKLYFENTKRIGLSKWCYLRGVVVSEGGVAEGGCAGVVVPLTGITVGSGGAVGPDTVFGFETITTTNFFSSMLYSETGVSSVRILPTPLS